MTSRTLMAGDRGRVTDIFNSHRELLLVSIYLLSAGWLVIFVRSVPFTGYETDGV